MVDKLYKWGPSQTQSMAMQENNPNVIGSYNHERIYKNWRANHTNKISEVSDENSRIILQYLYDMEQGLNISSYAKKGPRSFRRLNDLRQRLLFITKKLEERGVKDLTKISEHEIHVFFTDIRRGIIKRLDGGNYKDVRNFVKLFKSFWHWHQKVNRKKGIEIYDLTVDLDASIDKPRWVYLTEEQIMRLCNEANFKYRVLMMFLFDSGLRAPSELINIRVSDFLNDCKELQIRDEISKTFGRRIKLMLSSKIIKSYIQQKGLKGDDRLFPYNPYALNKYIQKLAKKVLGEEKSPAGQKYSQLTMYDFRHCSCCYWLPRYKSESALKYRFGWKKSDKIHYYSELLGMTDTIKEEDMFIDMEKTDLEKRIVKTENEKTVLSDRIKILEEQMRVIARLLKEKVAKIDRVFVIGDEEEEKEEKE